MCDNLNKNITQFFTTVRHENIMMFVLYHKTAQIDSLARGSADTIYMNCHFDPVFFNNFNVTFHCTHNFILYLVTKKCYYKF